MAGGPEPLAGLGRIDAAWAALAVTMALGLWLPRAATRPLWLDEALTVGATGELVDAWRHSGGTMALYYLVVTPLAAVTTDRFWLRFPSAVFGALAIVVVFAVGRALGGRLRGATAATLLASSWFLARYATEARAYTLALLLISLAWLGLVAAVTTHNERTSRRWWLLYVVAMSLAPLAHGLAAFQFPVQLLALALSPDPRRWLRAAIPAAAVLAVEVVVLFGIGAGDVANWIPPLEWRTIRLFSRVMFGRGLVQVLVGPLVAVATVWAVVDHRRERSTRTWLGLVPVLWAWGVPLLIVAITLVRPYATHRYILISLPGVVLLLAGLLARLPRVWATAGWVVVVAAMLTSQPAATTTGVEEWPEVAGRIAAVGEPGDLLLTPELLRAPLDYAFGESPGPAPVTPLSPTDPIGRPKRIYTTQPGTMRSQLLAAPAQPIWLVERGPTGKTRLDDLATDPSVVERFRPAGRWTYTESLHLLYLVPV